MKKGTTLTFSLLFILVTACFLYLEPYRTESPNAPILSQDVLQSGGSDITLIQIQNLERNETVRLESKNGDWRITYPVNYPADPMMAQGLNAALKFSHKARRLIPEKIWDEYGLMRPPLKIGVENKGGKRRYLYLGDKSPVGPFVYARWEGEKDYFLVSQDLKSAFDRSLYGLRQKKIFRLPLKDLTGIFFRYGDKTYEIKKQNSGAWAWVEPAAVRDKNVANQDVAEILNRLQDLNVKEFLDKEKPAADVDPGSAVLRIQAGAQSEKLQIGDLVEAQEVFRAIRSDETSPVLISAPNLKNIFIAWNEAFKKVSAVRD